MAILLLVIVDCCSLIIYCQSPLCWRVQSIHFATSIGLRDFVLWEVFILSFINKTWIEICVLSWFLLQPLKEKKNGAAMQYFAALWKEVVSQLWLETEII